jgi:hypothetical protein
MEDFELSTTQLEMVRVLVEMRERGHDEAADAYQAMLDQEPGVTLPACWCGGSFLLLPLCNGIFAYCSSHPELEDLADRLDRQGLRSAGFHLIS